MHCPDVAHPAPCITLLHDYRRKLDFALTPAVVHPLHQPRILLLVVCSRVRWPPADRTPPHPPNIFTRCVRRIPLPNPSHVLGNVSLPQPVTSASVTCSAPPPVIARKQVNFRHNRKPVVATHVIVPPQNTDHLARPALPPRPMVVRAQPAGEDPKAQG